MVVDGTAPAAAGGTAIYPGVVHRRLPPPDYSALPATEQAEQLSPIVMVPAALAVGAGGGGFEPGPATGALLKGVQSVEQLNTQAHEQGQQQLQSPLPPPPPSPVRLPQPRGCLGELDGSEFVLVLEERLVKVGWACFRGGAVLALHIGWVAFASRAGILEYATGHEIRSLLHHSTNKRSGSGGQYASQSISRGRQLRQDSIADGDDAITSF